MSMLGRDTCTGRMRHSDDFEFCSRLLGSGEGLLDAFQVSGETVPPFTAERKESPERERLSNLFWFFCFSFLLLLLVFLRPFFRFL